MVAYLTNHAGITDLTGEMEKWNIPELRAAFGGQGEVFRGTRQDGAVFAIKCINQPEEKQGKYTAQELSTWAKLSHPKILQLSGLAMFRGRLAMVSPWMEWGSVKRVLKDNPHMDPYAMCEQLVEVIQYLHDQNVIAKVLATSAEKHVILEVGQFQKTDRISRDSDPIIIICSLK
ncbi:Tyrosine kinase catalytic domain protein [Ceratobasidium sp. AG-Ba]|nr:Tyrosine kinase catalytic domain protein [Ceratobasidium sp. AG-Ba]